MCYVCKKDEELTNHLLLQCPVASILWQLIFSIFSVIWVLHSSVRGTLLSSHSSFVGKKQKKHGGQLQCSYSRHFG